MDSDDGWWLQYHSYVSIDQDLLQEQGSGADR